MKIIITDISGVVHENCPFCKGTFVELDSDTIACDDCEMIACLDYVDTDDIKIYFFSITLADQNVTHDIYWYDRDGGCMVNTRDIDKEFDVTSHLPALPFNITLEKLKIYLLFN